MKTVTFQIYGKPYGKARPRFTKAGHTYTPQETAVYENMVKLCYREQCGKVYFDGPVKVQIVAS